MKKKIISVMLAAMMLPIGSVYVNAAEDEAIIHVSVLGNDSADGTESSPLLTPEAAKEKVKLLKAENSERTIRVVFHEGEYRFEKGLKFTEEDSGSEEYPIIYEGAPGEKVEFKGSKKIDVTTLKPITDNKIKARLKPEIADKVGEINLKNFGITGIEKFIPSGPDDTENEQAWMYLNNIEQPLAQFPNGNGHFAVWEKTIYAGSGDKWSNDGGIIEISDDEILRWNDAGESYLGKYSGYDYAYDRTAVKSFDREKKTITLATGSEFTIRNVESKRWKIFNLLEELDSPGEWYIDRNNLMLYYYAPYNVVNAQLEISLMMDSFMDFKEAENIEIKNIEFSQSRGHGLLLRENTKNIIIENCSFENIHRSGVRLEGSERGTFESYYNRLNAPSYITINECEFYNIGAQAIFTIGGGNRETLTPSGIKITNNYVSTVSQKARRKPAFQIDGGVGIHIENNVMHNLPFHAINFFGNDHVIKYNDISNACMETTDASVLYAGRSFVQRGTEIAYNNIHDYRIKGENLHLDQVPAIYLDDAFGGVNIHHNIIENGGIGIMVNKGQDNIIKYNTQVNVDRPLASYTGGFGTAEAYADQSMIASIREVLTLDVWQESYPELKNILKAPGASVRNLLCDNLVNKEMNFDATVADYNTNKDNIIYDKTDIFVNPEGNDYRLKSDTGIAKEKPELLSDTNFDMKDFGFKKDSNMEIPKGDFKRLYPQNGDIEVNSSKIEFKWEEAKGAARYRLVVAKDPELKDIVVDEISYYNFFDVEGLKSGSTPYYYQVYAQNIKGEEWKSVGVNHRFTTSRYGNLDKAEFEKNKEYAESILPDIREGEGMGEYMPGTIDRLKNALKRADGMQKWVTDREGSQSEIDAISAEIKEIISEKNINSGYVGSERMVNDLDNWVISKDAEKSWLKSEGNVLTYTNKGNTTGTRSIQYKDRQFIMASKNTIFKTQMKFDLSKGWTGIALRTVVHDEPQLIYQGANPCYFFAIKENVIEFQKNPGGIMREIPNTFIKNGEWHDIEFGVLNTGGKTTVRLCDLP